VDWKASSRGFGPPRWIVRLASKRESFRPAKTNTSAAIEGLHHMIWRQCQGVIELQAAIGGGSEREVGGRDVEHVFGMVVK